MYRILKASAIVLMALICYSNPLHAWTDHALISYAAMQNDDRYSEIVAAEPIERFLSGEKAAIAGVLDDSERWGARHLEYYPPTPADIRFSAGTEPDILKRFVKALRVNPNTRFPLFLHPAPGTDMPGRAVMPWAQVSVLKTDYIGIPLFVLRPGEGVPARDVIAAGSDELDYGCDMFLWEDNGTPAGLEYKWGKQPFGNPAIEYATQAPFHMGFYHESRIIFLLAPALKKTFPEFRIHQYAALSRLAFKTGHRYWGYRFAGMALHYIQDLTNPYHSTIVPGASTIKLVFASILDVIGIHGPRNRLLKEISDSHIFIEKYQNQKMIRLLKARDTASPLIKALADTAADGKHPPFKESQVRTLISAESRERADRIKDIIFESISDRAMFDKIQKLDAGGAYDIDPMISGSGKKSRDALDSMLIELMRSAGLYTRLFLRSIP